MTAYNGHRSWNAWNVALWIGNDEGLYRLAIMHIHSARSLRGAALRFLSTVGTDRTPDGARYNVTCVQEAMRGLT